MSLSLRIFSAFALAISALSAAVPAFAQADDFPAVTLANAQAVTSPDHPAVTLADLPAARLASLPAVKLAHHPSVTLAQQPAVTLAQQPAVTLAQQPAVTLAQQRAVTLAQQRAVTLAHHPSVTLAHQPAVTLAHQPAVTLADHPSVTLVDLPAITLADLRIDNLGQVNDRYYRGAQPKGSDYADLAALGIKTVIDFQADGDNADEADLVEAAGMRFYRIPMTQHVPPTSEQIALFLSIVNDPEAGPVYVHCKGGRHRTGVMTAVYRMELDGWTADAAFREMKAYDFGFDFLHSEFKRFVLRYQPGAAETSSMAEVAIEGR
jgi:protein tyrosine phosphatase (PTP) superfamily phosphohydrolase (DUF442 family)